MRRVISLVVASGLLLAGFYLLYLEVFVARIIMGKMLAMAGLLIGVGGVWLWGDFISPFLRGKEVG